MLGWCAGAPGVGPPWHPRMCPMDTGQQPQGVWSWHRGSARLWGPWPVSSLEVEAQITTSGRAFKPRFPVLALAVVVQRPGVTNTRRGWTLPVISLPSFWVQACVLLSLLFSAHHHPPPLPHIMGQLCGRSGFQTALNCQLRSTGRDRGWFSVMSPEPWTASGSLTDGWMGERMNETIKEKGGTECGQGLRSLLPSRGDLGTTQVTYFLLSSAMTQSRMLPAHPALSIQSRLQPANKDRRSGCSAKKRAPCLVPARPPWAVGKCLGIAF